MEGPAITVLVVSPNGRLQQRLRERLAHPRWQMNEAGSGAEAFEYLHEGASELLLLDPLLPDLEPSEFSALVAERFPDTQVMTLHQHTGKLVLGTTSPTPLSAELAALLQDEGEECTSESSAEQASLHTIQTGSVEGIPGVVGTSQPMRRVYELTRLVARRDATVLITGQSGTGKDLIAQAVHLLSPREKKPLVVINCAAIPESLLEAELFGYTKGAFTGAVQSRIGRIHAAHGGTLFLDEIGDMPLSLQSKILRFLEQGEVQRIGGTDNLKVDVRVVAATNAPLKTLVEQKLFREDLYYRLAIFPIQLPPLRARTGDVALLAQSFVKRFCPHAKLTVAALELLEKHEWPGNVRELRNVLERASILVAGERQILPHHILL
ncbi:AAA domain-containing protein [Granulicella sp. 5B5]|nr:AAA domain-containing protein [Granulicella sp. 5B5]